MDRGAVRGGPLTQRMANIAAIHCRPEEIVLRHCLRAADEREGTVNWDCRYGVPALRRKFIGTCEDYQGWLQLRRAMNRKKRV